MITEILKDYMFAKYNKVLGASVESQNATSVVHLLGVIV